MEALPVAAINLFNGDLGDELGRHPRWAEVGTPSVRWLDSEVTEALEAGYRNIVFILPAGNPRTLDDPSDPKSKTPMAANQGRALKGTFQGEAISFVIRKAKLKYPDARFGCYTGYELDDEPASLEFTKRHVPDPTSKEDVDAFVAQWAPLVDLGFDDVWWDTASKPEMRVSAFIFSKYIEEKLGLRCYGEALPRALPEYEGSLADPFALCMPWMALSVYYDKWDPEGEWRGSEIYVGLRSGDAPTSEQMKRYKAQGALPFVYSSSLYDEVEKVWHVKGDSSEQR
tara:strand:+ start:501 stop:1355 length:855 start_codon:yes stop_codon:yes gene_type:complete